jgi:hypothetical protein
MLGGCCNAAQHSRPEPATQHPVVDLAPADYMCWMFMTLLRMTFQCAAAAAAAVGEAGVGAWQWHAAALVLPGQGGHRHMGGVRGFVVRNSFVPMSMSAVTLSYAGTTRAARASLVGCVGSGQGLKM